MANDLRGGKGRRSSVSGKNGTANGNRLAKLKKARGTFDITGIDTQRLLTAIDLAISAGGAIRVGLTRDGGAMAIGVYIDGGSETVYLNADDDQTEFWDSVDSVFTA